MMWLRETPAPVTQACMAMLPRLEAEEAVLAQNVVAMGSGTIPPEKSDAIAREWDMAMQRGARARRRADPSPLAAKGFAVRRVPYEPPVTTE